MTKHSHFPYTSIYSSTPYNTNRKHNIHHIPYTNIPYTSILQGYLLQWPLHNKHTHTVTTTYIKANLRHIHTSIVSRHLATRGNNKIQRTPPSHSSSSENILFRLTRFTLAQLTIIKHPFSNHTNTKSTPNHIHHYYSPFVTLTRTTHIISSTTPTYSPRCQP